eukprot:Seg1883.1 transcript_id=Seg1883.1/GoldUCD/mRNA.D3Y31 product="Endoplasmic reticulum resident protein 44" protein_id=Seg1883.1/GoldUCD/D3Y31
MRFNLAYLSSFITLLILLKEASAGALQLNNANYQATIDKHKVVLVNFYAEWCRFSQMLAPLFDQAAGIVQEEFPDSATMGKVDCETEHQISTENGISKYPTLKVFRNGKAMRKEYRGQRSVDAFTNFIRTEMKPSIKEFHSKEDFKPDATKNGVYGYFESRTSDDYKQFEKLGDDLRDDCEFWVGFGEASAKERALGDGVVFRPKQTTGDQDLIYTGALTNYDVLKAWAQDKCIPLVREITFENGEELTEEGMPFMLLFHKPDDKESLKTYTEVVARDLYAEKERINFLHADGTRFSHPLHHLEKTENDLPLIAIDSFRHMYLFPKFEDIKTPGKLQEFINDLHSGKLHREYHNGPDPTEPPQIEVHHETGEGDSAEKEGKSQEEGTDGQIQDKPSSADGSGSGAKTGPPETVFSKLMPSENRYTLLRYRDEL